MLCLSLFDGMSCGQLALKKAGIYVDTYYASEVDKYAIAVTQKNFPATVQLGDIEQWRDWAIDWANIDLLIGGSPCTGFSFAGKQLAFDDPRSRLFFVYKDILDHVKKLNSDVKFMLENVRMKKEFSDVITDALGVIPVEINAARVTAQNRRRNYWFNWEAGQPDDTDAHLVDIIDEGIVDRNKSHCIDANYAKGGNLKSYFEKHRRQLVFCGALRGRYLVDGVRQDGKMKTAGLTTQRMEVRYDGKTNTLTTVQKDNNAVFIDGYRKLTPIECERLQTVPDSYTNCVSNTQRFKMLGNGWAVDVIVHLFKALKETV